MTIRRFIAFGMALAAMSAFSADVAPAKGAGMSGAAAEAVMSSMDGRDFDAIVAAALRGIRENGSLDKPGGGRQAVFIGGIRNRTGRDLDTKRLSTLIASELLGSGKMVVTKVPPDVDAPGVIRPDLVLTGIMNELKPGRNRTEFSLGLELVDPRTGLVLWAGRATVGASGKPAAEAPAAAEGAE